MNGDAWGLTSEPALAWMDRGACLRHPPEWWTGNRQAWYGLARHICLAHCPVLGKCDARVNANPHLYAGTVIAGYLYVQPNGTGPDAARRAAVQPAVAECGPGCPEYVAPRVVESRSPCGTRAAAVRHRAHGEEPDPACAAAEREYMRERKAAQRQRETLAAVTDPALHHPCPTCGAATGQPCVWSKLTHSARLRVAIEAIEAAA